MKEPKNKINDGTHLTLEERKIIENGCHNGSTKMAIAQTIGKDKSTVGKKIKLHRKAVNKCTLPLECKNYKYCKLGRNCTTDCPKFELFTCGRMDRRFRGERGRDLHGDRRGAQR